MQVPRAGTTTVTTPSNCMVLRGVSWTTYQGLICDLESEPGKRRNAPV